MKKAAAKTATTVKADTKTKAADAASLTGNTTSSTVDAAQKDAAQKDAAQKDAAAIKIQKIARGYQGRKAAQAADGAQAGTDTQKKCCYNTRN